MDNSNDGYFDDELADEVVSFDPEMEEDEIIFEPDMDIEEEPLEPPTSRSDGLKARGRQAISRAANVGRERVYEAADRGKGRLADAIDNAADRLDGRLSHTADYLRSRDVDVIRDDFIDQVRRHPFLSAGIAVGTGYLLGKALGSSSHRGVRGRLRGTAGRQLRRALLSGAAALVAARAQDNGDSPARRRR